MKKNVKITGVDFNFPFEVETVSSSSIWGDYLVESFDSLGFDHGFCVLNKLNLVDLVMVNVINDSFGMVKPVTSQLVDRRGTLELIKPICVDIGYNVITGNSDVALRCYKELLMGVLIEIKVGIADWNKVEINSSGVVNNSNFGEFVGWMDERGSRLGVTMYDLRM